VVIDPIPEREAALAGVVKGDILLSVDGQPVTSGSIDPAGLTSGLMGEPVTILVQKADGSEQSYTIVRSEQYLQRMANAGLRPGLLAWYYVILYLLVGLVFAGLAVSLLLRRELSGLVMMGGFLLLFFPYSLNAANIAYDGALYANLDWLYNLLRAAGLFLTFWLLLIFPNGTFVPKWTRWVLVALAVWMVPYFISLVVHGFLPGLLLDISWMVIIALGVGVQIYRTLRVSTQVERAQARPVVQAALVALVVYVLVWVGSRYVTPAFSNPVQIWFSIISELFVDAALLFFGFRLMRSII
jgi:hypothetical protein